MDVKVTYRTSYYGAGWNQIYYLTNVDDMAQALVRANALGIALRDILAVGAKIYRIVLSDEDRAAPTFGTGTSLPGGEGVDNNLPGDVPSAAIKCNMELATGTTRPRLIRGIPDEWVEWTVAGAAPPLQAKLITAVGKINTALALAGNGRWAVKTFDRRVAFAPITPIQGVTLDPATGLVTYNAPGHPLAVRELVKIKGILGTNVRRLNLLGQVHSISGANFTIEGLQYPIGETFTYVKGGRVQKRLTLYVPIVRLTAISPVRRITGRTRSSMRGRARRRPSLFS